MVFPGQERMRCSGLERLAQNRSASSTLGWISTRWELISGFPQNVRIPALFSGGPLSWYFSISYKAIFLSLFPQLVTGDKNPPQGQQDKITRVGTVLRWRYGCFVMWPKEIWLPASVCCLGRSTRQLLTRWRGISKELEACLANILYVTQQKPKNKNQSYFRSPWRQVTRTWSFLCCHQLADPDQIRPSGDPGTA